MEPVFVCREQRRSWVLEREYRLLMTEAVFIMRNEYPISTAVEDAWHRYRRDRGIKSWIWWAAREKVKR